MISKLDLLFEASKECREKTHPCKMSKNSVNKIYKPDAGIKNTALEYKLFTTHPPSLNDCAIVYNDIKLALVEIKCGKVTNSELKSVFVKLENASKLLHHENISISKYILLYKQFENAQMKKKLATQKIYGQPLISKKYENKAIAI